MRNVRLWRALLGVDQRTVIEDIEFEEFDDDDADGEKTFHGWALLCFVTVPAKAVAVDLSVWQAAGAP